MPQGLPRVQHAVLTLLAERGRTHAYELKRILDGSIVQASVYASLAALESKGYLTSEWENPAGGPGSGHPRKYYEITAEGHAVLAEDAAHARAERRPSRRTAADSSTLGIA